MSMWIPAHYARARRVSRRGFQWRERKKDAQIAAAMAFDPADAGVRDSDAAVAPDMDLEEYGNPRPSRWNIQYQR